MGEALQKLLPVQDEMKKEVAELQKTLNEPQLDLELFRTKKNRFDQLGKLLAAGAQRAKTEQIAPTGAAQPVPQGAGSSAIADEMKMATTD